MQLKPHFKLPRGQRPRECHTVIVLSPTSSSLPTTKISDEGRIYLEESTIWRNLGGNGFHIMYVAGNSNITQGKCQQVVLRESLTVYNGLREKIVEAVEMNKIRKRENKRMIQKNQ